MWVYRMDKQKVSTLQALERISKEFAVRRRDLSVCGLKDKQGRTEQLLGVAGAALGPGEVVQAGDLRLQLIGRTAQPLTSSNWLRPLCARCCSMARRTWSSLR